MAAEASSESVSVKAVSSVIRVCRKALCMSACTGKLVAASFSSFRGRRDYIHSSSSCSLPFAFAIAARAKFGSSGI